jgi:hypothetical protein
MCCSVVTMYLERNTSIDKYIKITMLVYGAFLSQILYLTNDYWKTIDASSELESRQIGHFGPLGR